MSEPGFFDPNGLREIQPGSHPIFGQQIDIVANVDPDQFPNGLELIIMVPGQIQPFGKLVLERGAMLAAVPEPMRTSIRGALQRFLTTIQPQKIAAPGFD